MKTILSTLALLWLNSPALGQLNLLPGLNNPSQLAGPFSKTPIPKLPVLPAVAPVGSSNLVQYTKNSLVSAVEGTHDGTDLLSQSHIVKNTKDEIVNGILVVKDPIDKTITAVGSSQCSTVKRLVGMEYEQINYRNSEPDLAYLTLNFMTRGVSATYNLSTAASLIPYSSWFDPNKPLKIYMHGFTEDPSTSSFSNVGRSFLQQGDYNIVALDASSLIRFLYLRASTYVRFIGEKLGEVLAGMVQEGLQPSSIHLIGHSLGAQISGFAGKSFYRKTGKRVGRISGLDPAGPCFTTVDDDLKLNRTDADFVDVVHSDDGVFGLNEQLGHVDFYPNGGSTQPNCLLQTCSHNRAWVLYSESILNQKSFPAVQCTSWAQFKKGNCNYAQTSYMGFGCSPTTRGVYYLQTAGSSPFGRGDQGLRYFNNEGILKNLGSRLTETF